MIFEDSPSGHRLVYVRHLVEFAHRAGVDVTVAVTDAVRQSAMWRLDVAPLGPSVHLVPDDSLRSVRQATDAVKPAHTVVTDGDHLAMRIGAGGRWGGTGSLTVLLMRDPALERATSWRRRVTLGVKSALIGRARRVQDVHVVGLRSGLASPAPGIAIDPIERLTTDADVARQRAAWDVGADRYWYGVVGAVTARKNLPLVAAALALLAERGDPASVGLFVAGTCDPGVMESAAPALDRLRKLGCGVVVENRLLSSLEFDAAAQIPDCLVVAHSNEGPSAIIARAGMNATPVVAAGARSLQADVASLPAATWCELDADAMATAMARMRASTAPVPRLDLGTDQFCRAMLEPVVGSAQASNSPPSW